MVALMSGRIQPRGSSAAEGVGEKLARAGSAMAAVASGWPLPGGGAWPAVACCGGVAAEAVGERDVSPAKVGDVTTGVAGAETIAACCCCTFTAGSCLAAAMIRGSLGMPAGAMAVEAGAAGGGVDEAVAVLVACTCASVGTAVVGVVEGGALGAAATTGTAGATEGAAAVVVGPPSAASTTEGRLAPAAEDGRGGASVEEEGAGGGDDDGGITTAAAGRGGESEGAFADGPPTAAVAASAVLDTRAP